MCAYVHYAGQADCAGQRAGGPHMYVERMAGRAPDRRSARVRGSVRRGRTRGVDDSREIDGLRSTRRDERV